VRVRCVAVISATTGEPMEKSAWLTIGKMYDVLALAATPHGDILFRLVGDDDHRPGLFASSQFEIVDGRLPRCWSAMMRSDGSLQLGPQPWQRPGFWEEYFDDEPGAIAAYENAFSAIMEEA
jgi:hypothetical protein